MKKDIINVVYITDKNYAMPTVVSIVSLIENNVSDRMYQVYVLTNNLEEEQKKIFLELGSNNVQCQLIGVEECKYEELAAACLSKGIHVSDSALYKFDIANILSDIDKVLYLDGDIIVNQNISELFDTDIENYVIAAVTEMGDTYDEKGRSVLARRIELEDAAYFNSGVMLLNIKKIREEGIDRELVVYRTEKPNYFMDQDAFNGVMYRSRYELPCKYNFRTALLDDMLTEEIGETFYNKKYDSVEQCLSEQVIIHMSDKFKPWNYNIPWITDLFLKYYDRSPYKDKPLKLISVVRKWKEHYRLSEERIKKAYGSNRGKLKKIWGFPYKAIPKGSNIVLYGAGDVGTDFKQQIDANEYCNIVLWVDKNYEEKEACVKSPVEIQTIEYDYILVAIMNDAVKEHVRLYLKMLCVQEEKIVTIKFDE